ncbi:MAG: tetratricopeptide repeat protein [Verrucomicrobiota bacterium]
MKHWSDRTKGCVLFGLALLIYGFGVSRGFVFDDLMYISENPLLRRADAFRIYWFTSEAFNYYPLFWSLLRLQWLLWGDHPLGYHLVSLLVHCVNAVLVWRIGRAWGLPGAWWVAALFAVHPVNVQTIAWAAEQKNTWSFLFLALAVLAFIRHAENKDWLTYTFSLLCFLAALACKTSTVALPVFLALCYCIPWQKESRTWLIRLFPFFIASLAAGLTTMWFEHHRAGGLSLMSTLSLWQRMEAAGAAFWFYLLKAIGPIHLTPFYQGWVDTTAATHTLVPGALLVLLLSICAMTWRRIGAPVALGITYYALMMFPLLGIFDTNYFIYSRIADHWQYHALPGVLVAVVAVADKLGKHWPRLTANANALGVAAVLAVAWLASAHFAHFEDARTLWTYAVMRNPDAWIGWYNLGTEDAHENSHVEAVAAYRESIRIKSDYQPAHFNLGQSLAALGQLEAADRAFLDADAILPNDPDEQVNRAVVQLRLGREEEAVKGFTRALELEPGKISAEVNLITIHLRHGRIDEASAHLHASVVSSEANSRRIADAITASSRHDGTSTAALKRFAARACELSGRQRDLLMAWEALPDPAVESGKLSILSPAGEPTVPKP